MELVPRHHDVVDADAFEVEDVDQHAAVALRNHGTGIGYDRAQFLARDALLALVGGVHAQQAQQPVGHPVHRGNDGHQQAHHRQ